MKITVLNPANTKMVTLMRNIANATYLSVAKQQASNNGVVLDTKNILNNPELTKSMLVLEYKKIQKQLGTTDGIPTIIQPLLNSILSTSHTTDRLVALDKLRISPLSQSTINTLATGMSKMLTTFKDVYTPNVRNISKEVKTLLNTNSPEATIPEYYTIVPIKVSTSINHIYSIVKDVEALTSCGQVVKRSAILDPTIQLEDLELNMLKNDLYEDIKDNEYEMGIFESLTTIMTDDAYTGSNNTIKALTVRDINPLVLYITLAYNKLKLIELSCSDKFWLNICLAQLETIMFTYTTDFVNYDRLVIGYSPKTELDPCEIYVLDSTLKSYYSKNGMTSSIIGGIINEQLATNFNISFVHSRLSVSEILTNKELYDNALNKFMDVEILKYNNMAINRVRSIWELICNKYTGVDVVKNKISTFVYNKNLVELSDTDSIALTIYSEIILQSPNYKLFNKYFEEANQIKNSADTSFAAGYALYSLILLYLINQTKLVK